MLINIKHSSSGYSCKTILLKRKQLVLKHFVVYFVSSVLPINEKCPIDAKVTMNYITIFNASSMARSQFNSN